MAAVLVAVGVGFLGGMIIGRWYLAREAPVSAVADVATWESEEEVVPPPVPDLPPDVVPEPPPTMPKPTDAPAPMPESGENVPAWRRNAVMSRVEPSLPMIAVVIDDMGVDRRRSDRIAILPGPLTTSFLPYARDLPHQAAAARARGHELMVHVPMEPLGHMDPGPQVLEAGQPAEDLRSRLVLGLGHFSGFVGINNHMGSKFTADDQGMRVVMEELRARGLLFLDSMTTDRSLGGRLARSYGVPFVERDVFLDNEADVHLIRRQLARLEAVARQRGYAIAIGHPRDGTIDALAEWLPTLQQRGFALVPVSAIVGRRFPAE